MIPARQRGLVAEALRLLGKRRLVLGVHDAAFPDGPGDVAVGRGTPYGRGGAAFVELAARLGFDGLQLGPQGETSPGNDSPYDGTAFSRSLLSLALAPLLHDEECPGLVTPADLPALPPGEGRPGRASSARARPVIRAALGRALERLRAWREAGDARAAALDARLERFARASGPWLDRDGRFEALEAEHGHDWRGWPAAGDDRPSLRTTLEAHRLGQLLLHEQHRGFRAAARRLGLVLLADLPAGLSPRDQWAHPDAFVPGYLLGAPPSRTNPEGQAWGYPVLDPLAPAAGALLRARASKLLDEADGLRIDHPHGLIAPWVYRQGAAAPLEAVRTGARLRASPDLPDHPGLRRYAIPRPDQLDRARPRHDEAWEVGLEPEQVDRYAVLFDGLVEVVRARGLDVKDLACEILSTCPAPVAAVIARHGLGRFRVTEKADVLDPRDPYLGEGARPADWIMLATHDTPPVWATVERWAERGALAHRASYLARVLVPAAEERPAFARRLTDAPRRVPQAMLADAFASPAENVSIFFTDLLGARQPYNVPGTVSDDNWTLRVPDDAERLYVERLERGEALSIPAALAMALRARGASGDREALAAALEALPPALGA